MNLFGESVLFICTALRGTYIICTEMKWHAIRVFVVCVISLIHIMMNRLCIVSSIPRVLDSIAHSARSIIKNNSFKLLSDWKIVIKHDRIEIFNSHQKTNRWPMANHFCLIASLNNKWYEIQFNETWLITNPLKVVRYASWALNAVASIQKWRDG